MTENWVDWHTRYDDPASPLSQRLAEVRRQIALAGTTAVAAGIVPVDLLLLCGIFGSVAEEDIAATVAMVPALLAPGGTVIWTRGTWAPDLTPRLRSWFTGAGVEETSFVVGANPGERVPDGGWSVGAGVLRGPTAPLPPDQRLFTFIR